MATGAHLLWRITSTLTLPVLQGLPDGSYRSVLINPKIRGRRRQALLDAATAGADLDPDHATVARVVEYMIEDRSGSGELFCLITTILDDELAPAAELAAAYHQRWETYKSASPAPKTNSPNSTPLSNVASATSNSVCPPSPKSPVAPLQLPQQPSHKISSEKATGSTSSASASGGNARGARTSGTSTPSSLTDRSRQ